MRAVTYSRFSTDRQNESSIADQMRVCSEYAQRQGFSVTDQYDDQGISGAALGNRPGVLRLMEAALGRRFDVLLVMDLSRLSRSNADLSKMIDRLVTKGVRVIGVQDGYDSARKGHKLQAGLSGIIGEAFREMVKDRTYAALESRAKDKRPTGGRAYGYDKGVIEHEAEIVREIFSRAAQGESCRTIAVELNRRAVPSPGSSWARTQRRCNGWAGSGIRAMLLNERYTGLVIWNRSEWSKDPDSGARIRRERPASEWISHRDESQRIVSDALWAAVQRRMRPMPDDRRFKAGGKAKFLLSGLLRCDVCKAHYIISNAREYECGSHRDGAACQNGIRTRRDHAQDVLLGPLFGVDGLLSPDRIERVVVPEMQSYCRQRLQERSARAIEAPKALQELSARIVRLRERLERGDQDMTGDEIMAAIELAEAKRADLEDSQPEAKVSYRLIARLPKFADAFRRQIKKALDGDSRAAAGARVILRELFCGEIRLQPQSDGGLVAHWNLQPAALLRGVGTCGSGGRI